MTSLKKRIARSTILMAGAGGLASLAVFVANGATSGATGPDLTGMGFGGNEPRAQVASLGQSEASPFHLTGPNSQPQNLARASGLDNLPPETNVASIRRQIPSMRMIGQSDLARFKLTAAEGRSNSSGFLWVSYYSDDVQRQLLSVGSWNKVGYFNLVVPLSSPVTDYKFTTIDSLQVLTLLPSANVVGGLGPRTAFLYRGDIIYVIHGDGFFSDDSFMSVVHNFIAEVQK